MGSLGYSLVAVQERLPAYKLKNIGVLRMSEFKPTPNKMICNKAKECDRPDVNKIDSIAKEIERLHTRIELLKAYIR